MQARVEVDWIHLFTEFNENNNQSTASTEICVPTTFAEDPDSAVEDRKPRHGAQDVQDRR